MKKSLLLTICLFTICIMLSSCTKATLSQKPWDSVINDEMKESISLGSSKKEVEKVFSTKIELRGKDTERPSIDIGEEKERIQLFFQDDKVREISVGGQIKDYQSESNWSIRGISLGNTEDDVVTAFGDAAKEENLNYPEGKILWYYFDKNGNLTDSGEEEETVSVMFWLENSKIIYFIIS